MLGVDLVHVSTGCYQLRTLEPPGPADTAFFLGWDIWLRGLWRSLCSNPAKSEMRPLHVCMCLAGKAILSNKYCHFTHLTGSC